MIIKFNRIENPCWRCGREGEFTWSVGKWKDEAYVNTIKETINFADKKGIKKFSLCRSCWNNYTKSGMNFWDYMYFCAFKWKSI